MNLETVTRPMEMFRDQMLRLGETWAKEGRHYGQAALRTSAQALTFTAQRLDQLASRLAEEPAEAKAGEAPATESAPTETAPAEVKAAETPADSAPVETAPAEAAPAEHAPEAKAAEQPAASTGPARPDGGGRKKNRRHS